MDVTIVLGMAIVGVRDVRGKAIGGGDRLRGRGDEPWRRSVMFC